jgi:type VI secretion system secreted protein Hcp
MAVDMFCKIDGIDGESTDSKHAKWIEVLSYTHGLSQPVSGASGTGGRTGGRADYQDFNITKVVDFASADLNIHCSNGKHIPEIIIECCLASDEKHTFMKYTLTDCVITSVNASCSQHSETKPDESVTFAYGQIKWEYTAIDHQGGKGASIDRTWSLEENQKV